MSGFEAGEWVSVSDVEPLDLDSVREDQKEADAALVEAAGCTCKLFAYCRGDIDATDSYAHDPQEPRCPTTLADQIRRQP